MHSKLLAHTIGHGQTIGKKRRALQIEIGKALSGEIFHCLSIGVVEVAERTILALVTVR